MSATEVLTGVLVLVTAYYAWQNQRMVGEMRRSRELSVLPKLAVDLRLQGPTFAQVQVLNVGPGPALAVDLRIAFEPPVVSPRCLVSTAGASSSRRLLHVAW